MENVQLEKSDKEKTGSKVTFSDLISSENLRGKIVELGLSVPTPVQEQGIPPALCGRDLIIQAKTGSGKTLAFVLPLLSKLEREEHSRNTFALILTPTRELATQITQVIASLAPELYPACIIGGANMRQQIQALRDNHRIVVGTTGRIIDLIEQRELMLRTCRYFVLDEADEMLSLDFIEDVERILSCLPQERQGIFVSATISPRVEMLAKKFLHEPQRIIIDTPGEEMPSIEHLYCEVEGGVISKVTALCDLLETENPASALIFCNTKSDTELVEKFLRRLGYDARCINSNLNQRQRDYLMKKIKGKELRFLIGTDIAARGIDIEELDLVINYAIPLQPEIYVHRSGRTGRAGREGRTLSIVGPEDFTAFYALRKTVSIELKKLPLPAEEAIVKARISHLHEVLTAQALQPGKREMILAQNLLRDLGKIENPDSPLTEFVAKLYLSTIEHAVKRDVRTLDEEMGLGEAPEQRSSHSSGGRRGGHQRHSDHGRHSGRGGRSRHRGR